MPTSWTSNYIIVMVWSAILNINSNENKPTREKTYFWKNQTNKTKPVKHDQYFTILNFRGLCDVLWLWIGSNPVPIFQRYTLIIRVWNSLTRYKVSQLQKQNQQYHLETIKDEWKWMFLVSGPYLFMSMQVWEIRLCPLANNKYNHAGTSTQIFSILMEVRICYLLTEVLFKLNNFGKLHYCFH